MPRDLRRRLGRAQGTGRRRPRARARDRPAQTKQEYLSSLAGNPRTTTRRDLAVRVYGTVAVMTGVLVNAFGQGADRQVSEAYATQVWVAGDGGWRLVSFAASGPVPGGALAR